MTVFTATRDAPSVGPRLSAAGGVAISGIDLARPLTPAAKAAILAAFREHHFILFPDQALTREQQFAFAANFGEVERHGGRSDAGKRYEVAHVTANLDADGKPSDRSATGANYRWHTDKPYYPAPPLLTTLYAVELPPTGGDTEFANAGQAYAALPAATKRQIAGLRVAFRSTHGPPDSPPVDHPLVRTHPETGRKSLYLGHHSLYVRGLPEAAGAALLDELLRHATQPQFVHAHRWRRGDLVMWDNRCLLHRAVANYDMNRHRRIMHRSVVRGSVPF